MQKNKKIAIALVLCAVVVFSSMAVFYAISVNTANEGTGQLKTFTSYSDLSSFVDKNTALAQNSQSPFSQFFSTKQALTTGTEDTPAAASSSNSYSTTNIQVQGVDEADTVKTDGSYLYIASGDTIYIVQAQPADSAQVVSKIQLNGTYDSQLYLDNNTLVVISSGFYAMPLGVETSVPAEGVSPIPIAPGNSTPGSTSSSSSEGSSGGGSAGSGVSSDLIVYPYLSNAFVKVYDVSNRSNPVLIRDVEMNGSIAGSRMIGDNLYLVENQPAQPFYNSTVVLPEITNDNSTTSVGANEVMYTDEPAPYYDFVTVLAVNVADSSAQPTYQTFLASASSVMYVSQDNMYLTVPRYAYAIPIAYGLLGTTDAGVSDQTMIYRISLNGSVVNLEAQGSVPGIIYDQYSMDESGGYFRVATTEWTGDGTTNNVFVLNSSLDTVGSLQNISSGETIYSARFIGDRCYLVTYQQIDPFYVIDLSNPDQPQILGSLNISGVSDFLYPYDNSTIIGVGIQSDNVKLSLFNVSDVSNPTQISSYVFNATYSYTTVNNDPKAFLFDSSDSLLVLPAYLTQAYGTQWINWEGVFVFNVTADNGFSLRGTVTNTDNSGEQSYISRALYIGNVLYTISPDSVKLSDLNTLAPIGQVNLS